MIDDHPINALTHAAEAHFKREEYHVLGAWRAGYDYVHVFWPAPTLAPGEFSMPTPEYIPSNTAEHPRQASGLEAAVTYPLCEVDGAEEIRAAIRGHDRQ